MDKIIDLLQKNNVGILATSENNKPHGRPQHIHLIKDGKFYFTTANVKNAYTQLKENPYIEFIVTTPNYITVRLSGKINFADNLNEKQLLIDNAPLVKKGYETADNPIFEVFYLEHGEATYYDLLSGNPSEIFTI
ncbi:pyridoxamine 5'-phosphate oxidase family protein [Inconstantimicrobium mannanitabidum]|uniref:Pyridoxamine 5'-phosphate oxidase n=1 Tax=Inconstantimicrobium mannanitabidum TaxID=1604901 RepID=A0ACB5R7X9_9CLOT|nr:pyridoxamine 5'-phosphate oxidase family protein [Clostridium sp. TW13]GKX65294.1 pyridoxamine 5'-phosphate oxidase [Clostridium sp. TW13]